MVSLLILLLLLLSTSIPPLVSQHGITFPGRPGVQFSKPVRFIYANNQFVFQQFIYQFSGNPGDICKDIYAFLGLFSSALDIRTAKGEYLRDDLVKKLLSTAKEVKELFQGKIDHPFLFNFLSKIGELGYDELAKFNFLIFLLNVESFLTELVNTSTCQCTDGVCNFSNPIQNAPGTYTDLYIYQTLRLSGKGPSYWDAKTFSNCGQDPKCLVKDVRNSKSLQPTANPPGVTKPLELNFENEKLEFGKLGFTFKPELSNNVCKDVYGFIGLFASALDIRTSTGEYLQDDFTRKILTTAKEVKELFRADSKNQLLQTILSFIENISPNDLKNKYEVLPHFLNIKDFLEEILKSSTCQCTGGKCKLSNTIQNAPETYTELYIYQIARFIDEVPSSWDAKKFKDCGKDAKCLVAAVKSFNSLQPTSNSPGNNFHTTSYEGESSMVIKVYQPETLSTSIMVTFYLAFSFVF